MKICNEDICDLWLSGKTVCVTTNGYVTKNGCGVMGRGNAFAMKCIIPHLDNKLGKHLMNHGNVVGFIYHRVIAFPVKPESGTIEQALPHVRDIYFNRPKVPGFHCMADINIIKRSAEQLSMLMKQMKLYEVYLPVPGVGNGGLRKEDVLNIIEPVFNGLNVILIDKDGKHE